MDKAKIFPWNREADQFMEAFRDYVAQRVEQLRTELIPAENVQHFSHGLGWQSHNSSEPDSVSEMQSASHELTVKLDDVKNGRFEVLSAQAEDLVQAMHQSFMQLMFQTVSDGAGRIGNVVHGKGRTAEAILEMFEKIEFGVDREGRAQLPTIYVAPGDEGKFDLRRLSAEIPDIEARIEALKRRKSEAAELREAERKAKFKKATS